MNSPYLQSKILGLVLHAAAAEAMKKWDRAHSTGINLWRGLTPSPVFGVRVLPPGNFRKYWCKYVQFGAFWGHQVIKCGTENRRFSVPLLKVGRNLPSLPYRFRGPCLHVYKVSGEIKFNRRFNSPAVVYWKQETSGNAVT